MNISAGMERSGMEAVALTSITSAHMIAALRLDATGTLKTLPFVRSLVVRRYVKSRPICERESILTCRTKPPLASVAKN